MTTANEKEKPHDPIRICRDIVDRHQYAQIQGVTIDATTANAVLVVYDALRPENQKKMAAMPIVRMVDLAWKMIEKNEAVKT